MDSQTNYRAARAALAGELARVLPSARMIPLRWVRRIIRRHRDLRASAGPAPHEQDYAISRHDLLAVVEPTIAVLAEPFLKDSLPDRILLIPELTEEEVRDLPTTWHHRFEEAIFHHLLDSRFDERFPTFDSTRVLWSNIGKAQRDEVRTVLAEQNRLFPDDDQRIFIREATGLFLELWHFDRDRVEDYFPALIDLKSLEAEFEERLQATEIAENCRLRLNQHTNQQAMAVAVANLAADNRPVDPKAFEFAQKEALAGNDVRAMLLFERGGDPTQAARIQTQFLERIAHFLSRDTAAAARKDTVPPMQVAEWDRALTKLRQRGCGGEMPTEAKLLFDLQNACLDLEQPIYAVELLTYLRSLGRMPIKRELEKTRDIRLLRHLRSALKHAEIFADADPEPTPIPNTLRQAIHETEHRIREQIRPILYESFEEVGLKPANLPEKVALNKIVEELLDEIVARGFLRIGDVRDAIARNRLKLPDLLGPLQFLRGDPLLKLDGLLPEKLDGIYQRGEIYLRAFQRGSSLFFGTRIGRFFTRYVALPFGGALLFLEALHHFYGAMDDFFRYLLNNPRPEHVVDKAMRSVSDLLPLRRTIGSIARYTPVEEQWATWPAIFLLGLFLLGMFQAPSFRRVVFKAFKNIFWVWPIAFIESRPVQFCLHNKATRLVRKYFMIPLLMGFLAAISMRLLGDDSWSAAGMGFTIAFFSGLFFRTRRGREMEEELDEILEFAWRKVSLKLFWGALEWIFYFFRNAMEKVERGIYLVDEWLRYREGQSRFVYILKLLAGVVWAVFTYIFRFSWNLLVEPQINPIKHFPVVTVSHKLLLPMVPSIADSFGMSISTTTTIVFGIPGIFGFLAWELKENWKLYRANASKTIDPAALGSHGEGVQQLLRPGFHSGTIPKTFAQLRNSHTPRRIRKYHHQKQHIEEALLDFSARQIIPWLKASPRWNGLAVPSCRCDLATNQIGLTFHWQGEKDAQALEWLFEDRDGWLVSSIPQPGWLKGLPHEAQAVFLDALSGGLKLAGVAAFKPHTAWQVGCRPDQIEIEAIGLVIQQTDGSQTPIVLNEAFLENIPLSWDQWLRHWEKDQKGEKDLGPVLIRPEMI